MVNVKFTADGEVVYMFPGFKENYDTEEVSLHELLLRDFFKVSNIDKTQPFIKGTQGYFNIQTTFLTGSALSICYNFKNNYTEQQRKIADIEPSDIQRIIDSYFFVNSERNEKSIILKKYAIKDCAFADELVITAGEDEFQYSKDLDAFFEDAMLIPSANKDLKRFVCSVHEGHPALDSIREKFFEIFRFLHFDEHCFSNERIKILGYMVSENLLLLVETDVKSGLFDNFRDIIVDIFNKNPFVTHKPYPKINYSLSKSGNELVKLISENTRNKSLEVISKIQKLESLPNFGPNGLKILANLMSINFQDWNELDQLCLIFETYDIMPKVFFERAIRYSFYEGSWASDYIQIVYDYIHIREQLGFAPEKKMPKDIVSMHDSLQKHLKDIKDEATKAQFRDIAEKNSALAEKFNELSKGDFIIVSPKESKDLIQEGQEMHHCVGSYIDRYADGYSQIYFVRKADAPETAYATIELHDGELMQARGKYNTILDKKTMEFISNFADFVKGGNYGY